VKGNETVPQSPAEIATAFPCLATTLVGSPTEIATALCASQRQREEAFAMIQGLTISLPQDESFFRKATPK